MLAYLGKMKERTVSPGKSSDDASSLPYLVIGFKWVLIECKSPNTAGEGRQWRHVEYQARDEIEILSKRTSSF